MCACSCEYLSNHTNHVIDKLVITYENEQTKINNIFLVDFYLLLLFCKSLYINNVL